MVIAVSEIARKNYCLRQGIKEEKTVTIYNGTCLEDEDDIDTTALKKGLGLEKNSVVAGMFGRLIKEKGYQDAILAAEEMLKTDRKFHLLIVGDGNYGKDLENIVKERSLSEKVIFAGFRSDADRIMKTIDILIQPSWTESHESFGLVLIEAMAARKCVIASGIAPFLEVVEDQKNGYIFPEKDHGALAMALKILLDDPALREKMGQRGYDIVKEKFDARMIARKTEDVYRRVLS